MIKDELKKIKTNVDSISNSMENLKAKTDSDDLILFGLATDLPSVIKDSKKRVEMETFGANIYDALSLNSEMTIKSRLESLAGGLIPYLTGILPKVLEIKNTHYNWQDSFNNQYIPTDISHNILIRLLTTEIKGKKNIFGQRVGIAPTSGVVVIDNIRKVIEIHPNRVTVSDTVTPRNEVTNNTLYIANLGLLKVIYCKSLVYSNAEMFVVCEGDDTPEVALGKLGNFIG